MATEKTRYHIHKKKCLYCNIEYWAQKRDSKFCSKGHATAWRNSNDEDWKEKYTNGLKNSDKVKKHIKKISKDPKVNAKRAKKTEQQWEVMGDEMIASQKQAYADDPSIAIDRMKKTVKNKKWLKSMKDNCQRRWDEDYDGMIETCILPTLHKHNSKLEQKYEAQLQALKWNYVKQYILEGKVYDFYLPETNTLVEIDGRYWHPESIEEGKKYSKRQLANFENDKLKNEIAERNNFKLIRIRE